MIQMASAFAQGDSSFQKQPANLVYDGRASHDPALTDSMQGLWIQLLIGLDRNKAHVGPSHGLRDRFRIDKVALVRLDIGFYILGWHEAYIMTLLSQSAPQKVRSATSLHANAIDLQVRCKSQQLFTRKLLAHHHFAAQVQSHQMKYRLTQVNADQMQFHGCHLPAPFISQVRDLDRRRTIPLSGKRAAFSKAALPPSFP